MNPTSPCPDVETLAAFLDRALPPSRRDEVEGHLADCPECREEVADLARVLEEAALGGGVATPEAGSRLKQRSGFQMRAKTVALGLVACSIALILAVAFFGPGREAFHPPAEKQGEGSAGGGRPPRPYGLGGVPYVAVQPASQLPVSTPAAPALDPGDLAALPERATSPESAGVLFRGDRAQVVLVVSEREDGPVSGTLQVELSTPSGRVFDAGNVEVEARDGSQVVRIDLPVAPPDDAMLSVAFAGESWVERVVDLRLTNQEVRLLASDEVAPGSRGAARLIVYAYGAAGAVPVAGAKVEIALAAEGKTHLLWSGETDGRGVAEPALAFPALPAGNYEIRVRAESAVGNSESSRPIRVKPASRILLVTDKPLYQPGQRVELRALALDELSLAPASGEILFEIEDAKGNKVFKRRAELSAYGVAHAAFEIASEAGLGDYKIRAALGQDVQSEKTVTVKRYVLPRFEISVETEKSFYLPGETVKGTLSARYFFGKPVAGGKVEIRASTFDTAFQEFAVVHPADTDGEGKTEFEIPLPSYLVGQPMEGGDAIVSLEVTVTDTAEHAEKTTRTRPVAASPLEVTVVPESGRLVPGIENLVYVVATYPDGRPAATDLVIRAGRETVEARTDGGSGFATVKLAPRPADFRAGEWAQGRGIFNRLGQWAPEQGYQMQALDVEIEATDDQGAKVTATAVLSSDPMRDRLLLRLDRGIYSAGEPLEIDVFTAGSGGSVHLDVIKNRQTLLTKSVDVRRGHAHASWSVPPEIFGTLELHAYQVMAGTGEIVRDTRVVYVHPARALIVGIEPDRKVYRPRNADDEHPDGQDARIRFLVKDSEGNAVQGALAVIVVDSAVYALQEMQPGLEKVYFTLEQELQHPKYTIKGQGSGLAELVKEREALETKRDQVAQAILARVEPMTEYRSDPQAADPFLAKYGQALAALAQGLQYFFQSFAPYQDVAIFEADPAGGKIRYKADVLATISASYWGNDWLVQQFKDEQGNPLPLSRLLRYIPAFAPERAAAYLEGWRRQQLWNLLWQRLLTDTTILVPGETRGSWRFARDEIPAEIAGQPAILKDALGRAWTFSRLAASDPAFAPENLAAVAMNQKKQALLAALVARVGQQGTIEGLFERAPDGSWRYRPGAMVDLLGARLVEAYQALDPAGRPFDLAEIAAEDSNFRPEQLLLYVAHGRWWKVYSALAVWGWNHASEIVDPQGGAWKLPAGVLDRLVEEGLLQAADLVDPWGNRIELAADPAANFPYALDARFTGYRLAFAAADGKAGTADDIANATAVNYAGGWWGGRWARDFDAYEGYNEALESHDLGLRSSLSAGSSAVPYGGRFRGGAFPPPAAQRGLALPGDAAADPGKGGAGEGGGTREAMPQFVREWFPETLLFVPELVTDEKGEAVLPLRIADSITTWRLTASASSRSGLLGSGEADIRVFQDFFVEPDLPVAFTQNDEVSLPVAVYNYLAEPQRVRLVLESPGKPWFETLDGAEKIVELAANEVRAIHFRIKVTGIGERNELQVNAYGSRLADAVKKSVRVEPDGKKFEDVKNGRLAAGKSELLLDVPANTVPGSQKIIFKAYPGIYAQVLEGVEGILGAPHG
ncbi:MAG: zf-HC2 domain-containing protein [Planctomycetes bacterium]|nr:zf-HC2 domain-containing protein [Planctomycetota bacterium]